MQSKQKGHGTAGDVPRYIFENCEQNPDRDQSRQCVQSGVQTIGKSVPSSPHRPISGEREDGRIANISKRLS